MRIISGTYRGLRLKTLKSGNLRPTSDQLRETLFDVLGPQLEGSTFLDAYAGSGAVGLEAFSRGAREVVFIEHHRRAAELIRSNLAALEIHDGFHVMSCQVLAGLERLAAEGSQFDFVFVDPPYSEVREYHHVLRQIGRGQLLFPTSVVVAEHSRHCLLEKEYGHLRQSRLLRHGDAQLAFYRLGQPADSDWLGRERTQLTRNSSGGKNFLNSKPQQFRRVCVKIMRRVYPCVVAHSFSSFSLQPCSR